MVPCFTTGIGTRLAGARNLFRTVSTSLSLGTCPAWSRRRLYLPRGLGIGVGLFAGEDRHNGLRFFTHSNIAMSESVPSRSNIENVVPSSQKWKLYAIQGSQFVAKVMLALDATSTPYEVYFVNLLNRSARMKQLPTTSPLVPQVDIPLPVQGPDGIVSYRPMAESSDILQAIDDYGLSGENKLYPTESIRAADKDISSKINAYVLYFNHVSDAGWARSIRAVLIKSIPLGPINNLLPLRFLYRSVANSYRDQVTKELPRAELDDSSMTEGLITALEPYNNSLSGNAESPYLYGFKYPTAADVALHAMVSRFVGTMGDADLPPALPDLFQIAGSRLHKLDTWQQYMTTRFPLQWTRYKAEQMASSKL